MKKLILISLLSFFLIGRSFGQEFKPIKDSLELEKFSSYVNSVLSLKRDSVFPDPLPNNYKFVYRTSCRNEEVLYADSIFYTTEGKSFISDSISFKTEKRSLTHPLLNGKKITPFYCAENPSKLIEGVPVTIRKETIVTPDSVVIENIHINNAFFEYDSYGLTTYSSFISFENSKYLIIEFFSTTTIGSQTSLGITETLFLERIE